MNRIISIGSATLGAMLGGQPALADVSGDDAADLPTIVVTADPRRNRVADELVQPVSVLAGDELGLRQAMTLKQLQVKGPIFKMMLLLPLFQHTQRIYPTILREQGLR